MHRCVRLVHDKLPTDMCEPTDWLLRTPDPCSQTLITLLISKELLVAFTWQQLDANFLIAPLYFLPILLYNKQKEASVNGMLQPTTFLHDF